MDSVTERPRRAMRHEETEFGRLRCNAGTLAIERSTTTLQSAPYEPQRAPISEPEITQSADGSVVRIFERGRMEEGIALPLGAVFSRSSVERSKAPFTSASRSSRSCGPWKA